MKKLALRSRKQLIIGVFVAFLVVAALSTGVYALASKGTVKSNDSKANVSIQNVPAVKKQVVKQEATVTAPDPQPAVGQATQAPEVTTTPEPSVDAELEKRCHLVNLTISHIKSNFSSRGQTATSQDILNELSMNPRNHLANTYYQECVTAGKTQVL